jgi:hypothetical protein
MYSITCWRLRRSITRYVDGELTAAEAAPVQRHLARCDVCRQRVRVEWAVRDDLHARTARAGSNAWLPRPAFPARPVAASRRVGTAALATGFVILLAVWSSGRLQMAPLEAVGLISDSHCNGVHQPGGVRGVDPASCVGGCIKKGAHYVFVVGSTVYTIRNQDFADLVPSAGRRVQISGTRQGQKLTLRHVAPVR